MPRDARCFSSFALALAVAGMALLAGPRAARAADDLAGAKAAVEKKDWSHAVEVLQKVLGAKPDDREAALLAARVAAEGDVADAYPLAEDALHRVLKKDEKDRDVRLALARIYLARGMAQAADPAATSAVAAYFADAEDQFKKVLAGGDGTDEEAAAGIVEVQFHRGAFDEAVKAADEFLAKKAASPRVNFWKGKALYTKALDVYRSEGAGSANAKSLFERAKGAYEASVRGDPSSHESWMQLAYAAHYMGDLATAQNAYERALTIDPQDDLPMKGIEALLGNEPAKYDATLARLSKELPKSLAVRWHLAYRLYATKRYDEAAKALAAYAKEAPKPDRAYEFLGLTYGAMGQPAKAKEAFEAALKANPDNYAAAAELEKDLAERYRSMGGAGPKAALDLAASYKPLFAAAPKNPYLRNNLGFTLRESLNQGIAKREGELIEVTSAWLPVLKESVRVYAEAADLIGGWRPDHASLPFETRYGYAGILNDTGLMLWYYPQVRDVEKARELYSRALDFTDQGYRDACMNLVKLYVEQKDKDSARQTAEDCAERLVNERGEPDEEGRAAAKNAAERLR